MQGEIGLDKSFAPFILHTVMHDACAYAERGTSHTDPWARKQGRTNQQLWLISAGCQTSQMISSIAAILHQHIVSASKGEKAYAAPQFRSQR
jgi:hypothetical protein